MIVNAITGLAIALDCNAYLSKKQHLMIAFGKLFPHGFKQIITTNQEDESWAYTTTTRAPGVPRRCRSNRNVTNAGGRNAHGRCPHRNRTSPDH
jgi:hypothetical protein